MNARDVIASAAIEFLDSIDEIFVGGTGNPRGVTVDGSVDFIGTADAIINALTAAGYRIVGPGEVDAETVERCAAAADDHWFAMDVDWWLNATKKDVSAHSCRSVAAAIRNLKRGDND